MIEVTKMNGENIKTLLENSNEPLVFNNILKWKLLQWDMTKWSECLGDTRLQFRMGLKSRSDQPQWEKGCEVLKGTFEDFRKRCEPDNDKWLYFDYKYLNQWFVDKYALRDEINWDQFGYPNIKAEDSTMWIGSQGSHTPCHIDTYGFNLIAQVVGRKLWLLFPPEANLKPTRVPYEESTIYSSINFYTPPADLPAIDTTCKKVILEPGQVLFVPNGWWHYVENLDTAISINTWVPVESDANKRIEEAITLMMVKLLSNGLKRDEHEAIANNLVDLQELTNTEVFQLVDTSMECGKSHAKASNVVDSTDNTQQNADIVRVKSLDSNELQQFLKLQAQRFEAADAVNATCKLDETIQLTKKYLTVLTDPEVVALVKRKLVELKTTLN